MADDLSDFIQFSKDLRALAADFEGSEMEAVLDDFGERAVELVAVAVQRDLGGDMTMSRWPRARFDAQAEVLSPGWVQVTPKPRNRGPMKVAQFGRQAGWSRGRKGGQRRNGQVSTARAPRKVSASKPLNTWTDAGVELERLGPVVEGRLTKMIDKRLG